MPDKLQVDGARQRDRRREVSLQAFALRSDGSSVDVILLDLSYDGCLLAADETFEVGERLRLLVRRRGVVNAKVRWSDGGKAGLQFADDLAA